VRSVVLYELLSLDGVAEEPGDWLFDVDEEIFTNLGQVIERQDAVLLGRGTYDYWVDYWPTSAVEPFASFINATMKYVFTSSPLSRPWANSVAVDRSIHEYVTDLKHQPGGDIGVHGSIRLAQSLLSSGLVDELRLVVAPTLAAGDGGCSSTAATCGGCTCWRPHGPTRATYWRPIAAELTSSRRLIPCRMGSGQADPGPAAAGVGSSWRPLRVRRVGRRRGG
jgi:dihydrofolate reductase